MEHITASKEGLPRPLMEKYAQYADTEGFIAFSRFCGSELRKQVKSIAAFIDGDGGTNHDINFGILHPHLRFKGDAGDYDRAMVHKEDIDEFVSLVKSYYGM